MSDNERDITLHHAGGPRSVGSQVAKLIAPLARKRGTAIARLRAEWLMIVGREFGLRSFPERLSGQGAVDVRPAGKASPAGRILRLRVEGHSALEFQHLSSELIQRINAYFGRDAVAKLQLVQGPLPGPRLQSGQTVRAPDPARLQSIASRLSSVGDDPLRHALLRLGEAVLGSDSGTAAHDDSHMDGTTERNA